MILNIRGSARSGKSTNVHSLLRDYPSSEVWERVGWNKKRDRCVGHLLPGGLFIAGPYLNADKPCGIDVLMPGRTELVTLWLERNAVRYPHMIFESTTVSLGISRYTDLRKRLDAQLPNAGSSITFAFMDTPLEICKERIFAHNGKDDAELTERQWNRVQQIRETLMKTETCYDLDWRQSYPQVLGLLQQGGWDPMSTPPLTHPKVKTRYTLEAVWNELRSALPDDSDADRNKRFIAEMSKHADKFPVPA